MNKEQEIIINDLYGKISVVAGPGSGKTKTLIERVKEIINKNVCNQNEILLITFTNKVRMEIKDRLKSEIGINDVKIHTFHSFAIEIIKKYFKSINLNENLKIIEKEEIKFLLEESYFQLLYDGEKEIIDSFDFDELVDSEIFSIKKARNSKEKILLKMFEIIKQEKGYSTFDDLIFNLIEILKTDVALNIVENIKFLMVDECQDLNEEQYSVIDLLIKNNLQNVLLVGDLDQSIYSWRGAKPDLFKQFYLHSKKYKLKSNYRSCKEIVLSSKKLILNNKDRINLGSLITNKNKGSVEIFEHNNREEQAKNVVLQIKELMKDNKKIAVLFRAEYLMHDIINYFYKEGLFFNKISDNEFYSKREVKDILSLLKLLNDSDDILSWRDLINRFNILDYNDLINLKSNEKNYFKNLTNYIKNKNDFDEKTQNYINFILSFQDIQNDKTMNYLEKIVFIIKKYQFKQLLWKNDSFLINNINNLLYQLDVFISEGNSLDDFLLNLGTFNIKNNALIDLMTIHSSKGLEFDYVFILDVNQDILPHKKNLDLSEERRLMYVAMTRAKDKLFINCVLNEKTRKSIFIEEIK